MLYKYLLIASIREEKKNSEELLPMYTNERRKLFNSSDDLNGKLLVEGTANVTYVCR